MWFHQPSRLTSHNEGLYLAVDSPPIMNHSTLALVLLNLLSQWFKPNLRLSVRHPRLVWLTIQEPLWLVVLYQVSITHQPYFNVRVGALIKQVCGSTKSLMLKYGVFLW